MAPDTARSEVVIVGGGVIGVSTAHYLLEAGARVTLLEQGAGLAAGASYGNAGWIFPSHSAPIPGPRVLRKAVRWLFDPESPLFIQPRASLELARWLLRFYRACNEPDARRGFALKRELSLASRDCYEQLATQPHLDFGFQQRGLLIACETEAGLGEVEAELDLLRELGGEGQLLGPARVAELVPGVTPKLAGGAVFPADAHVQPADFVRQLGADVERRGAEIRLRTEVIHLTSSGRGVRIETTAGGLHADQLVLAAGAWSPQVAAPLGVRLPVEAAKGYSITIPRPEAFGQQPIMLCEAKVGVTPFGDRLRFAGTLELAGLDLRIRRRRVEAIARAVARVLPETQGAPRLEVWRGLRPCSPDDLPILGRLSRHPSVIVATGHGMSGIAQGPISGRLVAQLATGKPPELPLAPFSPARFGA